MPFENFDNKVKDAAEQHSPPFEERSWDKMQTLLDEHLPEKKKDRRRFFFLLFMVLLLGGGVYIVLMPKPVHTGSTVQKNNLPVPEQLSNRYSETEKHTPAERITPEVKKPDIPNDFAKDMTFRPTIQGLVHRNTVPFNTRKNPKSVSAGKDPAPSEPLTSVTLPANTNPALPEDKTDEHMPAHVQQAGQDSSTESEKVEIPLTTEQNAKKKKSSIFSSLAITLSAGPDVSLVRLGDVGKVQLSYGAGLSYQLSKKIALRTGFYVARKIYTAGPEDYDPPKNFWVWYPNLKKIEANCLVYEIPLIMDYHLGKRLQWFTSAGISSIIMKQEDYRYTYRPPSAPQYVTYSRTHKNENDHFFSMLHLSGGYSYSIGKNISLRAEPFVKIPLSGIGYGKIKLNSGGVMVTFAVKPFASK